MLPLTMTFSSLPLISIPGSRLSQGRLACEGV
jgi:hypothetical protein